MKQTLEAKWKAEANQLRAEAKAMPPGREREEKLRQARQLETASNVGAWLTSPGLQPPRDA